MVRDSGRYSKRGNCMDGIEYLPGGLEPLMIQVQVRVRDEYKVQVLISVRYISTKNFEIDAPLPGLAFEESQFFQPQWYATVKYENLFCYLSIRLRILKNTLEAHFHI